MQQKAYLPSLAAAVKPRSDSRTRPRLERIVFKTDRLEKSSCGFAVMGEELNGRYYYASKS